MMQPLTLQQIAQVLHQEGFKQTDATSFKRAGITAHVQEDWTVLRREVRSPRKRASSPKRKKAGNAGRASESRVDSRSTGGGLWKRMSADGDSWEQFDLPAAISGGSGGAEALQAAVHWALATNRPAPQTSWQPPSSEEVAAFCPSTQLCVRAGPLVAQGHVQSKQGELKLVMPLPPPAVQCSEPRRIWLDRVVQTAHHQWRLVRVVQLERARQLEVELTGSPREIWETLIPFSVGALRCVTNWLIWPISLLGDSAVACQSWELPPELVIGRDPHVA